uniref:Bet v I/Major latex protein domain-containing protein n=1 Tax=Oryza punctata TaxID=4537 RepID=A0A0E0JMX5_ORYPU
MEQAGGVADQWRGEVEATLLATPAAAAWPHLASFCSIHRYVPGVDTCERVAGEDGRPGCVRYLTTYGATGEVALWAREELLELDDTARRIQYSMLDNNMGFGRYVATLRLLEIDGDGEEGACKISWAYDCEPVRGMNEEGIVGFVTNCVKSIANKIEEAVRAASPSGV